MTTLTRFQDWPERLHEFVESRRAAPFKRRFNDCCTFAADAIKTMTGIDYTHELIQKLGEYRTTTEALKLLKDAGGLSVLVTGVLRNPIPVTYAGRGDVVLAEDPDFAGDDNRRHLGICIGRHLVAPGPKGLVFIPMSMAIQAWGV